MQRAIRRPTLLMLLLSLALLAFSTSAWAQDRVQVQVDVIVASNDHSEVDRALRSSASSLRAQFANFTGFRLASSTQLALTQSGAQQVALPGGSQATFRLQSAQQGRYQIQIAVRGGQTTFDAQQGGMIYVGGPRAPDGTIILRIRVL